MRYYPVFLDLKGQPCLVLGGSLTAAQKAEGLRQAQAQVTVISDTLVPPLRRLVEEGSVDWLPRRYRPGDLAGARLVIDASGDESVNRASWEEAEAAGVLINVVDRPQRCRFIAPAVVDRDPLVIAVSTSGESPFLAAALRARLERTFGEEWSPFVQLVGRVRRRLRSRGVPPGQQRRVYRRLLSSRLRLAPPLRSAPGAGAERPGPRSLRPR